MATNILETDDGDIAVATDGTQRWTTSIAEEVSQRLRAKYNLFLGEWFLDLRTGVPYYREALGVKPLNMPAVRAMLRKVATDDPAVESIVQFELTLDAVARRLTVECVVQLTTGEVLELEPFIV